MFTYEDQFENIAEHYRRFAEHEIKFTQMSTVLSDTLSPPILPLSPPTLFV